MKPNDNVNLHETGKSPFSPPLFDTLQNQMCKRNRSVRGTIVGAFAGAGVQRMTRMAGTSVRAHPCGRLKQDGGRDEEGFLPVLQVSPQ